MPEVGHFLFSSVDDDPIVLRSGLPATLTVGGDRCLNLMWLQ